MTRMILGLAPTGGPTDIPSAIAAPVPSVDLPQVDPGAADVTDGSTMDATHTQDSDSDPDPGSELAAAWELVHAAQDGNTAAFGALYDRYVDTVFRYVLFRLGDRELAEDVTSETFLRALRRITSVSYQGRDVGAWFITIARNLILDHVKSSRYRREISTGEIADAGTAPFLTGDKHLEAGPEHQVLAMATKQELLRCVSELGDDQRDCIILRFMQGLSVAETATIMNRNEGAIKALQHRAVRRLAQQLPKGLR